MARRPQSCNDSSDFRASDLEDAYDSNIDCYNSRSSCHGDETRARCCPMSDNPSMRRVVREGETCSQHLSRRTDHETNAEAACCPANESCMRQQFRAPRMNVSFFLSLVLLSSCCCCFCHGHQTGRSYSFYSRKQNESPRTKSNDGIASSLSLRRLRPEYKSLIEDASTAVEEASMSMSISFDISSSVKSMASEFLDNLHNKTSFESSSSPTFVPLLPFAFNATNSTLSPSPSLTPSLSSDNRTTNIPMLTPVPTPAPDSVTTLLPSTPATNAPSKSPTVAPTTIAPTTEMPTSSPSDAPVTPSPSRNPTRAPTQEPTESPSLSPVTEEPTTAAPTRSPVEGPQPTSSPSNSFSPSDQPSITPTTALPTISPTTAKPTKSPSVAPTAAPTPKPTVPLQKYAVPTTMLFYNSDRFKGSVLRTWMRVTSERIKSFTLKELEHAGEMNSKCRVDLEILEQVTLDQNRRLRGLLLDDSARVVEALDDNSEKRILQSSTSPLLVNFTTFIQFYSLIDDWNSSKFVASGFITVPQQRLYIFQLRAADTNNFNSIDSFKMGVNGSIITQEAVPPEPEDPKDNSTIIYASIGAAGGVLVTVLIIGVVHFIRKRKKRKHNGRSSAGDGNVFSNHCASPQEETHTTQPQSSSYFGTIESREGEQDDVSTLGDPYFGEAVNAVMDRDDTVAESMISAEQDLFVYGVGRPRLDTGASSRMDSTFSGKSNPNKLVFNDDNTLEDIYRTPECTIYDQEDSNSERLTVVAPAGKLGIVIDNPGGDIPVVHAVKETSVLNGKIKVGDFLLSVDEQDCRGMSAVAVSKLISSRSTNPSRTFALLRGAPTTGGGE
eukprot:CCRYP_005585-RA/>CCRYP_005585-RA protein AED:0.09 eAED:0.09 QI:183/1/1/1/1/1/3/142/836